jgi:hypothetical protein
MFKKYKYGILQNRWFTNFFTKKLENTKKLK